MKVVTLSMDRVKEHAQTLAAQAREVDMVPDVVVGVLRGGATVGGLLARELGARYLEVGAHRPSTPLKKCMGSVLRRLPRFVADRLRRIEHLLSRCRLSSSARQVEVHLPLTYLETLPTFPMIMIADDSVDTGATLVAVRDALKARIPNASFSFAAIAETQPSPAISPDFCVYRQNCLVRYPWSADR